MGPWLLAFWAALPDCGPCPGKLAAGAGGLSLEGAPNENDDRLPRAGFSLMYVPSGGIGNHGLAACKTLANMGCFALALEALAFVGSVVSVCSREQFCPGTASAPNAVAAV